MPSDRCGAKPVALAVNNAATDTMSAPFLSLCAMHDAGCRMCDLAIAACVCCELGRQYPMAADMLI